MFDMMKLVRSGDSGLLDMTWKRLTAGLSGSVELHCCKWQSKLNLTSRVFRRRVLAPREPECIRTSNNNKLRIYVLFNEKAILN